MSQIVFHKGQYYDLAALCSTNEWARQLLAKAPLSNWERKFLRDGIARREELLAQYPSGEQGAA